MKNSLPSPQQLVFVEQQGVVVALSDKQAVSLYKKSKQSGIPFDILEEVYRRGYSLWTIDLTETPEQFAFNRVNSFIAGGAAVEIDADLSESWAIATQTQKGSWKRVRDTKFSAKESAEAYGRKYHTGPYGEVRYRVVPHPDTAKEVTEVVVEPQSKNPNDASSRFDGTDSLTSIYKKDTPGQTLKVIRKVLKDRK